MNRSKLLELVISIFIYSLIVVSCIRIFSNLDLKSKINNIKTRTELFQNFLNI